MLRLLISLLSLQIAGTLCTQTLLPEVAVTFKVIPPPMDMGDQVYITGDHFRLGQWDPAAVQLLYQKDGSWMRNLEFKQGTRLEFKVTLSIWEREALLQDGTIPPNSVLEVMNDTTLVIHVPAWRGAELMNITFRVVSESIPPEEIVYITGNHHKLGSWDPAGVALSRQADGSWAKTISFHQGTGLEYKITLGSWAKEALADDGSVPPNASLEVTDDTTITIPIQAWK